MRIAVINLTGESISGGYREYLVNVIPRLAANIDVDALLFASTGSLGADKWCGPIQKVEFVDRSSFRLFGRTSNKRLQQKLKQFSPDVIFIPVEKPMKFKGVPVVTMIQNMEPLSADIAENRLAERMKCRLRYITGKMAVKNSARVIAVSGFVRDFLMNVWHVPGDKIGLVYHGLSFDKNIVSARPENIPFDWDGRFIFTAGSIRPARGLEDLILASRSVDFNSLGIRGVAVAGKAVADMLRYKQRLLKSISANGLAPRFIFLDEIDSSGMKWCYENCRAFVATSRVESFGMVGLEAMANGCLCVAADNPCLPEIFSDSAVYYKPKDAAGLANAINSVLSLEEAGKAEMSRKARERAAEFTWEKAVKGLKKELKNAVEENFNYR